MDFFKENAMEIYAVKGVSEWNIFFTSMIICIFPALLTYKVLEKTYTHESMGPIINDFKQLIKHRKSVVKKKEVDQKAIEKSLQDCKLHVRETPGNFHQQKNLKQLKMILESIEENHENYCKLDGNDEDIKDAS
jgi:hypothetical protein